MIYNIYFNPDKYILCTGLVICRSQEVKIIFSPTGKTNILRSAEKIINFDVEAYTYLRPSCLPVKITLTCQTKRFTQHNDIRRGSSRAVEIWLLTLSATIFPLIFKTNPPLLLPCHLDSNYNNTYMDDLIFFFLTRPVLSETRIVIVRINYTTLSCTCTPGPRPGYFARADNFYEQSAPA